MQTSADASTECQPHDADHKMGILGLCHVNSGDGSKVASLNLVRYDTLGQLNYGQHVRNVACTSKLRDCWQSIYVHYGLELTDLMRRGPWGQARGCRCSVGVKATKLIDVCQTETGTDRTTNYAQLEMAKHFYTCGLLDGEASRTVEDVAMRQNLMTIWSAM